MTKREALRMIKREALRMTKREALRMIKREALRLARGRDAGFFAFHGIWAASLTGVKEWRWMGEGPC